MNIATFLQERHDITLNEQQQVALKTQAPQTLLLAVPGSGKTTVLVSYMADLIVNRGVKPAELLTITFSRASARDMRDRFSTLFGEPIPQTPHFSTMHSFCLRLLRQYAQRYQRPLPRLIEHQADPMLRHIYRSVNEEYIAEDQMEQLKNELGLVQNLMLTKHQLAEYEITTPNFWRIHQQYQEIKQRDGLMDFDDILSFARIILQKVPSMREQVTRHYRYLQIDEAQDTSRVQYELVKLIADQMTLFVVGDEDQSIYGFRGAYPEGLLTFQADYPNATILKMECNYRSYADLVSLAGRFIERNQARYPKNMMARQTKTGAVLEVIGQDYHQQYALVVSEIRQAKGSIGVLFRNHESVVPLVDLLDQEGISAKLKQRELRFFDSAVVRDLMAFFRLSDNLRDLAAFEQLYYKWMCPKVVFLFVKQHLPRYDSVFAAALDCPDFPRYLREKFVAFYQTLQTFSQKTAKQVLGLILYELEYRYYLEKRMSSRWKLKWSILKTLALDCENHAAFCDKMAYLKEQLATHHEADLDQATAPVSLLSIHGSKGLEFDTVILLDFIDGVIPSQEAIDQLDANKRSKMEEEARLFYVAITRAKSKLLLFTANRCNGEWVKPSRFVTQLLQPDPTEVRTSSNRKRKQNSSRQ